MSTRYVGLAVAAAVALAGLVGALVLQQPTPAPSTVSQAQQRAGQAQLPTRQASINGNQLTLEVASTTQARVRGLSGRAQLPAGHGMLFVYETAERHGIWMKEMQFPLDILWLNERLQVIDTQVSAQPASYPETIFRPSEAARYVVELNDGAVERYNIEIGTTVRIGEEGNYPHR